MEYCLITFANTHSAMQAQRALSGQIDFVVMPTLREVTTSCGISLRTPLDQHEKAIALLKEEIEDHFYQLYRYYPQNGKNIVEPMEHLG